MNKLKQLRLSKKLSINEVAAAIGVHRSFIGRIEKNERKISTDTAKKLADFFGVTTDYILNMSDNPKAYTFEITNAAERIEALNKMKEQSVIFCTSKRHMKLFDTINALPENELLVLEASATALYNAIVLKNKQAQQEEA